MNMTKSNLTPIRLQVLEDDQGFNCLEPMTKDLESR